MFCYFVLNEQGLKAVAQLTAKEREGTCCGSFDENREGAFKNIFKTPESRLEVDCEAVNCIYNEGRHCQAEHIDVCGDGASRAEHTQCATFTVR